MTKLTTLLFILIHFSVFGQDSIMVVSPNGGELWRAGTSYQILWTSNVSSSVKIDLYKADVFHSRVVFTTSNDGSYNWTDMPFTQEGGSDYKIRITSWADTNITDYSDGYFTIEANYITVKEPNGGEVWYIGEHHFITWDDNLNGNIAIYLFKGEVLHLIIDVSDASDGSYLWTVPGNVMLGNDYMIHIESRDDSRIFDISDNDFTITNAVSVEEQLNGLPDTYGLTQNYPNPFNPKTKITYTIPQFSNVSLKVYDVLGKEIATLVNEEKPAESYEVEIDGRGLPSGIYFYRLQAGDYVETKKMVLIK